MKKGDVYNINTSKEQSRAIMHSSGACMVLAGPGSGKTYVITRRIQYLIEHYHILPEQILVITFTKAAAEEMKERFIRIAGESGQNVTFGTFHAVYFQIIKRSYHFDYSNIITEKEKREYLTEILEAIYDGEINSEAYIPLLLNDFSHIKNYGLTLKEYHPAYLQGQEFEKIYDAYHQRMRQERKIDFDDMVLLCHRLFTSRPEILTMWREVYRYILIDEFQDINRMQYEVIRLLAAPENNLFVVGDDDQSVYGFRGSDPSIMLGYPKDYPGCEQIVLKDNYRCSEQIVNKARLLIDHNKKRFVKAIKAQKKGPQEVLLTALGSKQEEADEIVSLLKHYRMHGLYGDIAILFRTNLGAAFLAQRLVQEKIPFWQKEKPKNPFDEPIALDILAILHFAYGENRRKYFLRFMNKPTRYIRRDMVEEQVDLEKMLRIPNLGNNRSLEIKKLIYDLNQVRKMNPFSAINYIRKGMGYEYWVLQNAKEKHRDREEELDFLNWLQNSAKGMETLEEWLAMIEEYEMCLNAASPKNSEDTVSLLTMHGSKGLEYKVVLLPDLNEGNVPQKKAVTEKEIEEERRLLYVAMTRAKERLFLFYVKKTKDNRLMPSRFLKEMKM